MTFALWCLFIGLWLPLLWSITAKWRSPNYNNSRPRDWMATQEGWRQRALWAQANAWEAFAPFAAAVLTAHFTGADQTAANWLAALFIVSRTLHGVFYIVDRSTLRSVAWFGGMVAVVGLFVAAASA